MYKGTSEWTYTYVSCLVSSLHVAQRDPRDEGTIWIQTKSNFQRFSRIIWNYLVITINIPSSRFAAAKIFEKKKSEEDNQ